MPLFNRRSRSVSTSRPPSSHSSNAHLAAAQAFLASQPSQSNLSASAAATALRTMSPPPMPVGQVQTKRMLNRQVSNSSITSAPRGRSKGTLQRRPSAGSMTERTFRSPSPGQPGSRPGSVIGTSRAVPPVPNLPATYSEDIPPLPLKHRRRSASIEVVSSSRVTSPPRYRPNGRGQSAAPAPAPTSTASNAAAAAVAARRSVMPRKAPGLQRSDSQDSKDSINFSYPRGSRPNSPPPRSPLGLNGEKNFGSPANRISPAETSRIQNDLTQVAAKPVKKNKKRVDPSVAQGSHLQTGTMGSKPTVAPLEQPPSRSSEAQTPVRVANKTKKAALTGQSTHFPDHDSSLSVDAASDSDVSVDTPQDQRAQRAAGLLRKHPSVVREDWEGEQEEQNSSPVQKIAAGSVKSQSNLGPSHAKKPVPEANMSRKIEDPHSLPTTMTPVHDAVTVSPRDMGSSGKKLLSSKLAASNARGTSISPSRSTRFSDRLASDLAAGRKHEPLGRSISPAKSALKHSSIAGLEASPTDSKSLQVRGTSRTPSETSEISADGSAKKRSSRVSFEVQTDTKDPLPEAYTQKETGKKSWLGFGKGKTANPGITSSDDESEEGMKPRPALPSFGSVRRGDRPASPTMQVKQENALISKTASSSETSSITDPPTMDTSVSSDYALRSLLPKSGPKSALKTPGQGDHEPVPPQVTTVEGTGYVSDTESAYSEGHEPTISAAQTASNKLKDITYSKQVAPAQGDEVPFIAVQPATPGLDEPNAGSEWPMDVPGGFPPSASASNSSTQESVGAETAPLTSPVETTDLELGGNAQEYADLIDRDGSITPPLQQLTTIEEEQSDDSLYSDAAEDLSDLEGDGFGSINAIVESPAVTSIPQRKSSSPDSPSAALAHKKPAAVERTASWDDTQAHWSGLAQRVRNGNQTAVPSSPVEVKDAKIHADAAPKTKKTKAQATAAAVSTSPTVPKTPPRQSAAPKRVRQQPSTLPATGAIVQKQAYTPKQQGPLRSSMRGEPEPVSLPSKQNPAGATGTSPAPRAALQKKKIPAATARPPPAARKFSEDSDSDSSFKKARRNRKAADKGRSMRQSMRAGSAAAGGASAPGGRKGVRSLSPPPNRRPTSPMGMKSMRSSMRGSVDTGAPTLRGKQETKRSSSLFSRNRRAKSPTRPASAVFGSSSKVRSRIVDSDDEERPGPAQYRSRFADSSDEDEPKELRPVRGIPRTREQDDSTDLDDSSDDQARKSKSTTHKKQQQQQQQPLTIVPPPPEEDVSEPPLSPASAKKRGLWNRLRGKKKDDEARPNADLTIVKRREIQPLVASGTGEAEDITKEASQAETENAKDLGFSSQAERDALIEQTRLKLEAARDRPQSPMRRPQSPLAKLQRRMTPQRILSDSWAPPRMSALMEERPVTSDGFEQATRPAIGSRQSTAEGAVSEAGVVGRSGKKKKFGLLRKAFGLTD